MNFLKSIFLKNLSLINYLIIFLFFLYAIILTSYHYDGHHVGLIYSNSIDFINGKLPYKEIFIQYGILTTIINSIILIFFQEKIFFIIFFNSIFYTLAIIFISKTIKNFTNLNFAFLGTILILFNHPVPWLPWSNYIAFFFISLSLYFLSKTKKNYFLIGLILSMCILTRQDFLIPILFTFIFFCIFFYFLNKNYFIKKITFFIIGFFIPILIFLIYLKFFNIYHYWLAYFSLPQIYLNKYEITAIRLIIDFIIFFSSEAFFSFIVVPQYFLISLILTFNSIILILILIKKIEVKNEILFILIFGIFLSALSLKIELFRLYTSVIIGLIGLLYSIYQFKDSNLKKNLLILLFLPSFFSICFYPMGNNKSFNQINFSKSDVIINYEKFSYNNWPQKKIETINVIFDISTKCKVEYLENLSWDTLYSTIGDYDRIKKTPWAQFVKKNFEFTDYVENIKNPDKSFIELINTEINNSNIILLISENNHVYKNKYINIHPNYNVIEINESNIIGKPKILRIYYPNKCIV